MLAVREKIAIYPIEDVKLPNNCKKSDLYCTGLNHYKSGSSKCMSVPRWTLKPDLAGTRFFLCETCRNKLIKNPESISLQDRRQNDKALAR